MKKQIEWDNLEDSFIEIYEDKDSEFADEDLFKMLYADVEIDEVRHGKRRWSEIVETIVKINNRYFAILWEDGLTEMQENYINEQPYEVEKEEIKIVKTIWKPVKK